IQAQFSSGPQVSLLPQAHTCGCVSSYIPPRDGDVFTPFPIASSQRLINNCPQDILILVVLDKRAASLGVPFPLSAADREYAYHMLHPNQQLLVGLSGAVNGWWTQAACPVSATTLSPPVPFPSSICLSDKRITS